MPPLQPTTTRTPLYRRRPGSPCHPLTRTPLYACPPSYPPAICALHRRSDGRRSGGFRSDVSHPDAWLDPRLQQQSGSECRTRRPGACQTSCAGPRRAVPRHSPKPAPFHPAPLPRRRLRRRSRDALTAPLTAAARAGARPPAGTPAGPGATPGPPRRRACARPRARALRADCANTHGT
eukprot:324499-Chlamydomonas_euryale.AAC.2